MALISSKPLGTLIRVADSDGGQGDANYEIADINNLVPGGVVLVRKNIHSESAFGSSTAYPDDTLDNKMPQQLRDKMMDVSFKLSGSGDITRKMFALTYTMAGFGNKQDNITVSGMLKGTGTSVVAATAGTDYASPALPRTVTLGVAAWTGAEAPFQQTVSVSGATATNIKIISPAPASVDEYASCGVKATTEGAGTITFACTTVPENALTVNVVILR